MKHIWAVVSIAALKVAAGSPQFSDRELLRCDVPAIRWAKGWALVAGEILPARRSARVDYVFIP